MGWEETEELINKDLERGYNRFYVKQTCLLTLLNKVWQVPALLLSIIFLRLDKYSRSNIILLHLLHFTLHKVSMLSGEYLKGIKTLPVNKYQERTDTGIGKN